MKEIKVTIMIIRFVNLILPQRFPGIIGVRTY